MHYTSKLVPISDLISRKKIELKNATDEERLAAYDRKKQSRARYREKNRVLLAQKARERRAKQ